MVSTAADVALGRARSVERPMYLLAAIVAALIIFAGFAPTYYLKTVFGTPDLTTLKHVHGVVMTSWFALFATQAWLVSARNVRLHVPLRIRRSDPKLEIAVGRELQGSRPSVPIVAIPYRLQFGPRPGRAVIDRDVDPPHTEVARPASTTQREVACSGGETGAVGRIRNNAARRHGFEDPEILVVGFPARHHGHDRKAIICAQHALSVMLAISHPDAREPLV